MSLFRAASLDHLVGARKKRNWQFDAERLDGLQIDHQLELVGLLHRQISRLFALEDAIDVGRSAPEQVDMVDAVGRQTAGLGKVGEWVDRRQTMPRRLCEDTIAMNAGGRAGQYDESAVRLACQYGEGPLDIGVSMNGEGRQFHAERWRARLDLAPEEVGGRIRRIVDDADSRDARRDLLEQFQLFCRDRQLEQCEPCDIAAGPGQTHNETPADWIGDLREHDRYGACDAAKRIQRRARRDVDWDWFALAAT